MQQNLMSQKNSIIAAVAVLLLLGGGYFFFMGSGDDNSSVKAEKFDPSLLSSKDLKDYYAVKGKINLSDMSYINKPFYLKLKDHTVDILPKAPSGRRSNPFIPLYAPTGSIR